jgi:hypothetical protein
METHANVCIFSGHYENHIRRVPMLLEDNQWNYSANLCPISSLLDCADGVSCRLSHRVQRENIYHPSVYKTQLCESIYSDASEGVRT